LSSPYLPIGEYGPYPERLRQQLEGGIWRFKTGGQWREMPQEFGAWPTVSNRFRQWRDADVFQALLEGLIAEAAKRGEMDLSLVSIDSTTARAHHDAAGMQLSEDILSALEKAGAEEKMPRSRKGGHYRRIGCGGEGEPERTERRRIRRRRNLRLKAALLRRSRAGRPAESTSPPTVSAARWRSSSPPDKQPTAGSSPARLNDLDRGPHPKIPLITTRYAL